MDAGLDVPVWSLGAGPPTAGLQPLDGLAISWEMCAEAWRVEACSWSAERDRGLGQAGKQNRVMFTHDMLHRPGLHVKVEKRRRR